MSNSVQPQDKMLEVKGKITLEIQVKDRKDQEMANFTETFQSESVTVKQLLETIKKESKNTSK